MGEAEFGGDLDCLAGADQGALPVISVRPDGMAAALAGLDGAEAFVRASGFTGASGQLVLLPGGDGVSGALLGLGTERSLWAHGALPLALPDNTVWRFEAGDFDMEAAVLGFC